MMSAPIASGGSVTSGGQSVFRWHRTFIDVEDDGAEVPVDPRVFRTDPGFHGGFKQEHQSTFGEEVAYVQGLAERVTSTWGVSAQLGREDEPGGGGPATSSPAQPDKAMDWRELRARVQRKTKLMAQTCRRPLAVLDEVQEEPVLEEPFATAERQAFFAEGSIPSTPLLVGMAEHPAREVRAACHPFFGPATLVPSPPAAFAAGPGAQVNQVVAQMILQAKASDHFCPDPTLHSAETQVAQDIWEDESPETPPPPPLAAELAPRNPGSAGHPALCMRPCLYFSAGQCVNGDACHYCHMPHAKRAAHFDKRHREMIRQMSLAELASLALPVLRRKVQDFDGSSEVVAFVDDMASICGVTMPEGAEMPGLSLGHRHHRTILATMKSMELRLLLATVANALSRHRPEIDGMSTQMLERLRAKALAGAGLGSEDLAWP